MMHTRSPTDRDSSRSWSWGLAISVSVFAALCWLGVISESYGFALVLGSPFVCGFIIGRWVGVTRVLQIFLALVTVASLLVSAITAELAGLLCGAIFFVLAGVPLVLGVLAGSLVFGRSRASTSVASVAAIALLIPLEQGVLPARGIESVATTEIVTMPPAEVFSRITFYEDTNANPPTLLRIALPRPLRTEGEAGNVGSLKRCIYESGHLVKEVSALQPGVRYAFRVIEQVGIENRSVELVGGSFELAPIGRHRTRVVLTTRYRPRLSARSLWRPFERAVVHALHQHVLRSMLSNRTDSGSVAQFASDTSSSVRSLEAGRRILASTLQPVPLRKRRPGPP